MKKFTIKLKNNDTVKVTAANKHIAEGIAKQICNTGYKNINLVYNRKGEV